MTLMQLVKLLRTALNENHPPEVLKEITSMIEQKIEEGLKEYEHIHIKDYMEVLKQKGVSNKEFAEKAGIGAAHLSQILKGKKPDLSLKTMKKIVKASGGAVNKVEDFLIEEPTD